MSLKENVDFVKQELNNEEKFLESFIKVERFYKKYKALIIGTVAVLTVCLVAFFTNNYIKEQNKIKTNIAFESVLKNPKDKEALSVLKDKNTKLYNLALFLQAKKEGKIVDIDVKFLKELADYQKAIESKNINDLDKVTTENNFLLKEFAIFNKALILATKGEVTKAKETLKLIPSTSQVSQLKSLLEHYLTTK